MAMRHQPHLAKRCWSSSRSFASALYFSVQLQFNGLYSCFSKIRPMQTHNVAHERCLAEKPSTEPAHKQISPDAKTSAKFERLQVALCNCLTRSHLKHWLHIPACIPNWCVGTRIISVRGSKLGSVSCPHPETTTVPAT